MNRFLILLICVLIGLVIFEFFQKLNWKKATAIITNMTCSPELTTSHCTFKNSEMICQQEPHKQCGMTLGYDVDDHGFTTMIMKKFVRPYPKIDDNQSIFYAQTDPSNVRLVAPSQMKMIILSALSIIIYSAYLKFKK